MIKTAGGWKSDTVARKYIEKSAAMKDEIAASFNQKGRTNQQKQHQLNTLDQELSTASTISANSCSNVVFNIYNDTKPNQSSSSSSSAMITVEPMQQPPPLQFEALTKRQQIVVKEEEDQPVLKKRRVICIDLTEDEQHDEVEL